MSSGYICEEPLFIHNNNIFEWTPGEKQLRQHKEKSGYDAILDILDSLGYYGVRFHTKDKLVPFEVIIGGLSWCIGYIKPEYNYDISFSEGMSLGNKIALSERIIECLREMEYSKSIWPQQIQGLDFHAIEPIFRWLYDKINEIRNSLPRYECVAAQHEFDDAFVFDAGDCPSNSLWGQYTLQSSPTVPSYPTSPLFVDSLSPCEVPSIRSFHDFMNRCNELTETFHESFIDDSILSEPVPVVPPTEEAYQLYTLRQDRIASIEQLAELEQQKQRQIDEYTLIQTRLQDTYKHAKERIHDLSNIEMDPSTSAKVQELKNRMQLFETLTFQYNQNMQFYQEDLAALNHQLELRQLQTEHEEEQFTMIQGIHTKVKSSLTSLLSIYRSINREILKGQCYLEQVPSTPELLFFEYEITGLMERIMEKALELSQCYDMRNHLNIIEESIQSHLELFQSFLTALKNPKNVKANKQVLNDQLNGVIQQLSRLTQQYNCELKKKNRVLKTMRGNEMNVVEKVRSHSKLMQTFRTECENNKELMKRIRELQRRRS